MAGIHPQVDVSLMGCDFLLQFFLQDEDQLLPG